MGQLRLPLTLLIMDDTAPRHPLDDGPNGQGTQGDGKEQRYVCEEQQGVNSKGHLLTMRIPASPVL